MKQPCRSAVDKLPSLGHGQDAILARYLIATEDYDQGACAAIVEGLGYGVGQITTSEGTSLMPCAGMFHLDTSPSRINRTGDVTPEWHYVDIEVDVGALDLGELGFSGLLSLLAGDVFGAPYVKHGLVLDDLSLPLSELGESFPGPRYGRSEVAQQCGHGDEGFLFGLLLKPDLGVSAQHYADIVDAAIQGGVDYIKEDELTLESSACPRLHRAQAIADRIHSAGARVLYAANATGKPQRVLENAEALVGVGANAILINGLQTGLDIVAQLATSEHVRVPLHLHRAGYDIMSTGPKAISVPCLTKLFRICGADIVHVGAILGGLFSRDTVVANLASLLDPLGSRRQSLPVFSRSSQETISSVADDSCLTGGMLLFDAEVYSCPLGIERGVRDIKKRIASIARTKDSSAQTHD